MDNLNTHNIWALKLLIAETIYFLNVIGNIYLMDIFLGGEFRTYGIQVIAKTRTHLIMLHCLVQVASMMQEDPEDRLDPMARIFPRVTKCTFKKFGPSGTLQTHDSLCVLPVNIINEVTILPPAVPDTSVENLRVPVVLAAGAAAGHLHLHPVPPGPAGHAGPQVEGGGGQVEAGLYRNMMLRSRTAHMPGAVLALDQVEEQWVFVVGLQ